MNTYQEIKLLVDAFNNEISESLSVGILSHIERAEYYFNKALDENDDQYFTDIIYRCNHAYEGILKEAYSIYSGQTSQNITPDKIERYFLDNKIFKERVRNYFSSYRSDWRNPSTHDNKLFFSKEESFMAIVSVSSFIYLLLSQLLESKAYQAIKQDLINNASTLYSTDNLVKTILAFSSYLNKNNYKVNREVEVLGYLRAYLENIYKDIEFIGEYKIGNYRIDIAVIINNKVETIIEIKKSSSKNYSNAIHQVMAYMDSLNCNTGIIYLFDNDDDNDYEIVIDERLNDNKIVYTIKQRKLTTAST